MEQSFRLAYGSNYWYSRFVCVLRSLHLRWKIYDNEKENSEKVRIPSYKGNEIEKIMDNLELIINESVSPHHLIDVDWSLNELKDWISLNTNLEILEKYKDQRTLNSAPCEVLLIEVFDHLRNFYLNERPTDCIASQPLDPFSTAQYDALTAKTLKNR